MVFLLRQTLHAHHETAPGLGLPLLAARTVRRGPALEEAAAPGARGRRIAAVRNREVVLAVAGAVIVEEGFAFHGRGRGRAGARGGTAVGHGGDIARGLEAAIAAGTGDEALDDRLFTPRKPSIALALGHLGSPLLFLPFLVLDRAPRCRGSLEESRCAETERLVAVEVVSAGDVDHGPALVLDTMRPLLERLVVLLSQKLRVVRPGVQRPGAANRVVERTLGESVHRPAPAALPVSAGVERIEGSIVMEHCNLLLDGYWWRTGGDTYFRCPICWSHPAGQ